MYDDLVKALRNVESHKHDPEVNLFDVVQVARDSADAIEDMNRQLISINEKLAQFRRDSVILSLMVLTGGAGPDCNRVYRILHPVENQAAKQTRTFLSSNKKAP